ncbi:hypothetical protein BDZ94DRAFT_1305819 [Collybia nuda]|uniref:Amine oxidase domain-containing protein n=1 Tax=Collybia nuda TaxID=64659 RepID=A0A9P5YG00_9AGAR|nr:hypothetical protein BDZ94DRAFT_1305819 [Collybia nuda]
MADSETVQLFSLSSSPFLLDTYALYGRHLIQEFHKELGPLEGPISTVPASFLRMSADVATLDVDDSSTHTPVEHAPVGILGAGPGGLYTALILEDLGIPYRIIEAQKQVGGRLFTHKFTNTTGAPYNYFDVGAMRFPKISSMARVFKLFAYPPLNTDGLALSGKLKPFRFEDDNAFDSYNGVTVRQGEKPNAETFKADQVIEDADAALYIKAGPENIVNDVIAPFAIRLLDDLKNGGSEGWKCMKSFDQYSTRAYMSLKYKPSKNLGIPLKPLPTDVVNWLETFDKSTGWYDRALSETVLEAIAFGWRPVGSNLPKTEWSCIDGGAHEIAETMAKYIISRRTGAFTFNSRVTAISVSPAGMEVVANGTDHHQFSHVISTIPLPVLRTVDLSEAKLSPMQSNALRSLDYGPSVKIGMQFKTAWWTTGTDRTGRRLNIIGGQTHTDRSLRTVVYPSFGNVEAGKTTTLIASYCWTEDAARFGAMIGKHDAELRALVLRELADIHNVDAAFLSEQLIEMKAWSWSHDPYTMGAFAFFGPGKFGNLYKSLTNPAGGGLLHFAGEAISVRHAWVEGALDSAWRAVREMLLLGPSEWRDLVPKFEQNWGKNPEWNAKGGLKGSSGLDNDLILKNIILTHPELFE